MYRQRLFLLSTAVLLGFGLLTLLFTTVKPAHAFAGDAALEFNGTEYVRITGVMGDLFGTDQWTNTKSISLWVRPSGDPLSSPEPGNLEPIVVNNPRWFGISRGIIASDGQDRIWVWSFYVLEDNTSGYSQIPIDFTPDEWVHITMVHADGFLSAYKNGVLVDTIPAPPTYSLNPNSTNRYMSVGGSGAGARPKMTGQVDEVAIWSTGLTGSEVGEWLHRQYDSSHPSWDDLRVYYQLSTGSGSHLIDSSQYGNFGKVCIDIANCDLNNSSHISNNTKWVASGAFAGPRNALQFDGVNDYVALNANADTALGSGWATAKTAELWAKPTGSAPSVSTAAAGDILFAGPDWGISQANLGSGDRLYVWHNDGSEQAIPIDYESGQWVHIALTHDGTNLTAYRNGRIVDSIASSSTANDGNLFIGGLSSGQAFQGELDELRLWRSVRTANQIQAHLLQTLAGSESDLAAYYRFDQYNAADQTSLYDVTANNLHGTLHNINPNTAWVASTAFNTWIGSDSDDWADGRNWSQFSPPTAAANVGIPNYPNSLGAVLSDTAVIQNLYIAPAATLTLTQDAVLTVTEEMHVAGTLVNNGRIQQTKPVNGVADVAFLDSEGTYGGVIINANDEDLGDTLVAIRSNQDCTTNSGETILRCFNISPENNSGRNATITFYFLPSELGSVSCTETEAYHWNGAEWSALSRNMAYGINGRICTDNLYSIQVTGVSNFSAFAVAGDSSPTAVSLAHISTTTGSLPYAPLTLLALLLLLGSGLALARFR